MIFKRLYIKNFMSVGSEGLEIDFTSLNGAIVLKGKNLDVGESASNGAGKSLIMEAIFWALYGKTMRGLGKNEVINNINQKRCVVELEVEDLRIIRSRKPNKLLVFQDAEGIFSEEKEITLSTMPRTEAMISEILRVDYTTFCNIIYFGQHNPFSFVSADEKTKRQIVEDLLSLSDYNYCLEQARKTLRGLKGEVKELIVEYNGVQSEYENLVGMRKKYKQERKTKQDLLAAEMKQLSDAIKQIEEIDLDSLHKEWAQYEKAQALLPRVKTEIDRLSSEICNRKGKAGDIETSITKLKKEVDKIENLKSGVVCSSCFSEINPSKADPIKKEKLQEIAEKTELHKDLMAKVPSLEKAKSKSLEALTGIHEVKMPKLSKERLNAMKLERTKLESSLEAKQKQMQDDPYKPLIEDLDVKIKGLEGRGTTIKKKIDSKEGLVPYLSFWENGFGPEGIRSFIVENVVGYINNRINYWLQFLIDNKIKVVFDRYLNVDISRSTDEPFTYKQGSGGEKRRIDFAISLAFADLMRISNNTFNNILFLDEVVDSLDFDGVSGISQLISELAQDRTLFIITHNRFLLELLEGSEHLTLVKQGGFTKLESAA